MSTDEDIGNENSGAWEETWRRYAEQIDERIVGYMEDSASFSPQTLAELSAQLRDWLDKPRLSGPEHEAWCLLRGDETRFRALIEQRIAHLVADGRIKLQSWRAGGPD